MVEDDKFRLCVPPVYRGMSSLLKDLEEAFYRIKNVDQIRPSMVFPDVTKLGMRYSFFEGLGFIEYGQFSATEEEENPQSSKRNSLVTEVRSDRSFNQSIFE